jgi:hypothetical protein
MTRSQENVSVALQEGSDVLEFPGDLEVTKASTGVNSGVS